MASATHEAVPNQGPKLIIVSCVFISLTFIAVTARLAWRWAHRQRGYDDAMVVCAFVILLIQTAFGGISEHYGFGKHLYNISKPNLSKALEYFYLYQICYKLLGGFTKASFLFLYLRIFNQRSFQRLTWITMAVTAVGSITFALGTVFQCNPVHRSWNHTIKGTCMNNQAFWYSHAAFNTAMDIFIYFLPIPVIRSLKLANGQKAGLISIFLLGGFVIAASIVRMVMLKDSSTTNDQTWGSMNALIWTEIESNTSIICCCLPALRVPFMNLWHRARGDMRTTSSLITPGPQNGNQFDSPRQNYSTASAQPHDSQHSGHSHGTWYDKMLHSLTKDDTEATRSSSQDHIMTEIRGTPPTLDTHAIYKTTDVHVSMSDMERGGGERNGSKSTEKSRDSSLRDILNER